MLEYLTCVKSSIGNDESRFVLPNDTQSLLGELQINPIDHHFVLTSHTDDWLKSGLFCNTPFNGWGYQNITWMSPVSIYTR